MKQSQAIAWLTSNNANTFGDAVTPRMYVEECFQLNADGSPDRFLRDDLDPYLRPLYGVRYLGASRLRVTCDENFAFSPPQLERLQDLVDLKSISLFAYTLTDDQLAQIAKLPRIENLHLDGAKEITDRGAMQIVNMNSLYELEINGSQITDETLRELCRCKQLREVVLDGNNKITYNGARLLRDTLYLTRFSVSECAKITLEQQSKLTITKSARPIAK